MTALALAERLHLLVDELAIRGVPISTGERIDALRAASMVTLARPEALQAALSCTLIKSADHLPVFADVYRIFFGAGGRLVGPANHSEPTSQGAGVPEPAIALHDSPVPVRSLLAGLSEPEMLDYVLRQDAPVLAGVLARQAVERHARFQPGLAVAGYQYLQRTMAGLRLDAATTALLAATRSGAGDGRHPMLAALAEAAVIRRSGQLRELIVQAIREKLVADRGPEAVAATVRPTLPENTVFGSADPATMAQIERMLAPLARRLATTTLRRRRRRAGALDLRATVRTSMSTGGVPFRLHNRPPAATKPRLYVLADVSSSVAPFASLTIALVCGLGSLYSRLRTFAFVSDVAEITDVVRGRPAPEAVRAGIASAGFAVGDGGTDYGRVLRQFHARVADQLDHRATVLIFGDGRGNYRPAHPDILADIARRAGRVYWLTPENREQWLTGDSAMRQYAPLCTQALVCRTLNDLRDFVAALA